MLLEQYGPPVAVTPASLRFIVDVPVGGADAAAAPSPEMATATATPATSTTPPPPLPLATTAKYSVMHPPRRLTVKFPRNAGDPPAAEDPIRALVFTVRTNEARQFTVRGGRGGVLLPGESAPVVVSLRRGLARIAPAARFLVTFEMVVEPLAVAALVAETRRKRRGGDNSGGGSAAAPTAATAAPSAAAALVHRWKGRNFGLLKCGAVVVPCRVRQQATSEAEAELSPSDTAGVAGRDDDEDDDMDDIAQRARNARLRLAEQQAACAALVGENASLLDAVGRTLAERKSRVAARDSAPRERVRRFLREFEFTELFALIVLLCSTALLALNV